MQNSAILALSWCPGAVVTLWWVTMNLIQGASWWEWILAGKMPCPQRLDNWNTFAFDCAKPLLTISTRDFLKMNTQVLWSCSKIQCKLYQGRGFVILMIWKSVVGWTVGNETTWSGNLESSWSLQMKWGRNHFKKHYWLVEGSANSLEEFCRMLCCTSLLTISSSAVERCSQCYLGVQEGWSAFRGLCRNSRYVGIQLLSLRGWRKSITTK